MFVSQFVQAEYRKQEMGAKCRQWRQNWCNLNNPSTLVGKADEGQNQRKQSKEANNSVREHQKPDIGPGKKA